MSFNVGDRVRTRTTNNVGEGFRGLLATVTAVNTPGNYYIEIDSGQTDPTGQRREANHGGVWDDATLEPAFTEGYQFANNDPELQRLPRGTILTRPNNSYNWFVNGDGTFTTLPARGNGRRLGIGRRIEGDDSTSDYDYWVADMWTYVRFDLSLDPHAESEPLRDWERDLLEGAFPNEPYTVTLDVGRINRETVALLTGQATVTTEDRPLEIGDRVIVNGRGGNPTYKGQKGTIVSGSAALQFRVEFDNSGEGGIFNCPWSPEFLDLLDEPNPWLVGQRVWHKTAHLFGTVTDPEPDENLLDLGHLHHVTVKWDDDSVLNAAPHNLISEGDRLRDLLNEQIETSAMHEAVVREEQEEVARLEAYNEKLRERADRVETLTHELDRANERVEEFRKREEKALKVAEYAKSFVSGNSLLKVAGYVDGLNDA